jgi:DNA (cytosine-5)-methyltransferase 1
MFTVGSLFSGIGGMDLGLERAGMTVIWQSEIDPYACRVLTKHWPNVPNLGDVTTIDWSTVERPDLVCGGYPCQPFSLAGTRGGDTDPRHLWPHFRDALRHLRPRWALLENVPGHLSLGFGRVLGDLAELGYDCEWDCIPAAAVGAPHLRYRVFVVARNADSDDEDQVGTVPRGAHPEPCRGSGDVPHADGEPGVPVDAVTRRGVMVPDAECDVVRQQPVGVGRRGGEAVARHDGEDGDVADAAVAPSRTGLRESDTGTGPQRVDITEPGDGGWWAVEPDVGRVAHGVPHRMDRLRTLGNAVVPQVAEMIGRRIMEVAA